MPYPLDPVHLSTKDFLNNFHAQILTRIYVRSILCVHKIAAQKTVNKKNLNQRKCPEENKESLNYMSWLFAKRINMNLKAAL